MCPSLAGAIETLPLYLPHPPLIRSLNQRLKAHCQAQRNNYLLCHLSDVFHHLYSPNEISVSCTTPLTSSVCKATVIAGSFLSCMLPSPFISVHLISPKHNTLQLSLLNFTSLISNHFSNSSYEILNLSS